MFAARPRRKEDGSTSPRSPISPDRRDSNDPHNDEGEIVPHTGRPLMKERARPSWFFDHRTPSIPDISNRWRASKEKRKASEDAVDEEDQQELEDFDAQPGPSTPRTLRRPSDPSGTRLNRLVSGTNGLRLQMPTPPERPFTLNQNQTPGWDSPWVPHNSHRLPDLEQDADGEVNGRSLSRQSSSSSSRNGRSRRHTKSSGRKADFRHWLLHNNYAPLVSIHCAM